MQIVWLAALAFLTVLSVRSAVVTGRAGPATAAGWWATAAYGVLAAVHVVAPRDVPAALEYAPLVFLTIAFVVAGRRDEPQAEPWWWPVRLGRTGAERRAAACGATPSDEP